MRQNLIALHRPDREARKVVIAALVEPRHFGGVAADERATRFAASRSYSLDDLRTDLRRQLAACEVVEEEQRLGTLNDEVFHRHRNQIDPDGFVSARLDCD